MDIEHLSNDIEQMQFENNRIYDEFGAQKYKENQQQPYRSEMNLILSFDGSQPTFTEEKNDREPTQDLKYIDDNLETPPPKIPLAMDLLPIPLPYVRKNEATDHPKSLSASTKCDIDGEGNTDRGSTDTDENHTDTLPLPSMIVPPKDKIPPKPINTGAIATVRRHFFPRKSSASKMSAEPDNSATNVAVDDPSNAALDSTIKFADDEISSQPDYERTETVSGPAISFC